MTRDLIHPLTGEAVVVRLSDYAPLPRCSQHPRRKAVATRKTSVARRAVDPLLDHRCTAELWLAGLSAVPRELAYNRARKGEYRRVRVQFADGTGRIVGNYLAEDHHALAWAIKDARSIEMTARLPRSPQWWRSAGTGDPIVVPTHGGLARAPGAYSVRDCRKSGGYGVRARVCPVPDVADAVFIDGFDAREHVISRSTAVQLKMDKLAAMTTDRGASEAEAYMAQRQLDKLKYQHQAA